MKSRLLLAAMVIISVFGACRKYINIVPDNVATIDYAFRLRTTAERYLFTCYSYMPQQGTLSQNAALCAGDEVWFPPAYPTSSAQGWQIARGFQRRVDPYVNAWQGTQGSKDLYEGIRTCNVFLENIDKVPDMAPSEKRRWTAEAKFLKAYYHFWLLRQYGPIPLNRVNFPVSAPPEEVQVYRDPVDTCFNYITQLLDEAAIEDLPARVQNETTELGRITRSIVLAFKAQVLVSAASPFFNGNADYAGFKGLRKDEQLFSQTVDQQKWVRAAEACKAAIELCEATGYKLNIYTPPPVNPYTLNENTKTILGIQMAVSEKWNSEVVWGNTNNMSTMQALATPRGLDPTKKDNTGLGGLIAPTLKMAELFYTKNGVPINEDKTWDYGGRYNLKVAGEADKNNIKLGYTTVSMHFDREPRFYADLAFDGGIWYGLGNYDDTKNLFYISCKKGEPQSMVVLHTYSTTGYWPKKLVSPFNTIGTGNTYTIKHYPWPVIRMADLYLLYAEALNEVGGPGTEVYDVVNKVRARAGLKTVQESWTNFSKQPSKYTTKEGMRQIVQQERLIEMSFEGQRYWDLRRWKKLAEEMNMPIQGWDLEQSAASAYYRVKTIYMPRFGLKDYLWPINESEMLSTRNLVQNPGW